MIDPKNLRVCMECGTVFTKITADRIFLKCPNCKSSRRDKIKPEESKS